MRAGAFLGDLYVRRAGARERTKLVCLHGFADSGLMFTPLFGTDLALEFEIVAVDLPGFGMSPRQAGVETIVDHAEAAVELVKKISPSAPIGFVAHSVASAIAVCAVQRLPGAVLGVFSIEGNLCEEDAYFTGCAIEWENANDFKAQFLEQIRELAETQPIFRRYERAVAAADAVAMWQLGRDAWRLSQRDAMGHAYANLSVPALYYWSRRSTGRHAQDFIAGSGIRSREFEHASHWPTVDAPESTAEAIGAFFTALSR